MNTEELLNSDRTVWEIGPYHGALPGPMKLKLVLDGEIVVSSEVETGFLHRGLEKAIELHNWRAAIAYCDHLDPEAAVFGELALCLAVEKIAGYTIPSRAVAIRVILSELTRISSHLLYTVKVASSVGAETLVHYVLRDRERILDLLELLTGARFSINFLRFGGVRADVTEGFIERVQEVCDLIQIRMKEYNDLFTFNHAFLKRTEGVGIVSQSLALLSGLSGPNARASGIAFDVRKACPYLSYGDQDFDLIPSDLSGDAHARFLIRLREINESIGILKHVAESVPSGPYLKAEVETALSSADSVSFAVPRGEAYVKVEAPRGLLGCHVFSDGSERPVRVQFRPPSIAALRTLPKILPGIWIEDLPVVLASFDISLSEADR